VVKSREDLQYIVNLADIYLAVLIRGRFFILRNNRINFM